MSALRKTTQYLLPVEKQEPSEGYDLYPLHDLGEERIFCDYLSLARRLSGHRQVVIDGYVGVRFDIFARQLGEAFASLGIRPVWWSTEAALKPSEEIDALIAPYLGGDDPIFGFRAPLSLSLIHI